MVAAAIQTTLVSLKATSDLVKALIGVRDHNIIQAKATELISELLTAQQCALSAQAEQFAMSERIRELEKEIEGMKNWDTDKQNYILTDLRADSGRMTTVYAYVSKELVSSVEKSPKYCANCFDNGKKSLLQGENRIPGMDRVLVCHSCGSDLYLTGGRHPEHKKPRR